jgi:hypothetical protein
VTDSTDDTIEANIAVFPSEGRFWLLIAGELFGPFENQDNALNAIPDTLRMLD